MTTNIGIRYDEREATFRLTVVPKKGKRAPRDITERALGVTYTDTSKANSDTVTVKLSNEDSSLLYDEELMRKGTILALTYGYPGLSAEAGHFAIKNIKGNSAEVIITANERQRGRMARRKFTRVWDNTTHSAIVRQILGNHGFPDSAIHIDETAKVIESVTQRNEHDWQFLWRLAQLNSFEFYLTGDGVHWEKPKRNSAPVRTLRYVKNPIGIGSIIDYSFDGNAQGVPGRVKLKGYDPILKRSFAVTSDKESADEYVELSDAAGADDPDEGDREDSGDIGAEIVRNTGAKTEQEAKTLADSIYKGGRYNALKLNLTVVGDPTLTARSVVAVWGLGPALDGQYWLQEVQNTLGQGFQQALTCTREGIADKLRIKRRGGKPTIDDELRTIARNVGGAVRNWIGPWASGD